MLSASLQVKCHPSLSLQMSEQDLGEHGCRVSQRHSPPPNLTSLAPEKGVETMVLSGSSSHPLLKPLVWDTGFFFSSKTLYYKKLDNIYFHHLKDSDIISIIWATIRDTCVSTKWSTRATFLQGGVLTQVQACADSRHDTNSMQSYYHLSQDSEQLAHWR